MAQRESSMYEENGSGIKPSLLEIKDYCICDMVYKFFKAEQLCDVSLKAIKGGKM